MATAPKVPKIHWERTAKRRRRCTPGGFGTPWVTAWWSWSPGGISCHLPHDTERRQRRSDLLRPSADRAQPHRVARALLPLRDWLARLCHLPPPSRSAAGRSDAHQRRPRTSDNPTATSFPRPMLWLSHYSFEDFDNPRNAFFVIQDD